LGNLLLLPWFGLVLLLVLFPLISEQITGQAQFVAIGIVVVERQLQQHEHNTKETSDVGKHSINFEVRPMGLVGGRRLANVKLDIFAEVRYIVVAGKIGLDVDAIIVACGRTCGENTIVGINVKSGAEQVSEASQSRSEHICGHVVNVCAYWDCVGVHFDVIHEVVVQVKVLVDREEAVDLGCSSASLPIDSPGTSTSRYLDVFEHIRGKLSLQLDGLSRNGAYPLLKL